MDKIKAKSLAEAVVKELERLGQEQGVVIKYETASYSQGNMKLTISLSEISKTGEVNSPEREAFKRLAESYGLRKEWLDRTFTSATNKEYKVVGLRTRKRKYPVLCSRNGELVLMTPQAVIKYMK